MCRAGQERQAGEQEEKGGREEQEESLVLRFLFRLKESISWGLTALEILTVASPSRTLDYVTRKPASPILAPDCPDRKIKVAQQVWLRVDRHPMNQEVTGSIPS